MEAHQLLSALDTRYPISTLCIRRSCIEARLMAKLTSFHLQMCDQAATMHHAAMLLETSDVELQRLHQR